MAASDRDRYDRTWGIVVGTSLYALAAWNIASGAVHLYKSDSNVAKMWATRPAAVRAVIPSNEYLNLEKKITDYLDPEPMRRKERRRAEEPWNAAEDWGVDALGVLALNAAQKRIRCQRRVDPDWYKFWTPEFWEYLLRWPGNGR